MLTDCYFEKQLQEAYTNEIFKLFQDELRGILYCNITLIKSDGQICTFQVTDIFRGKEGKVRRQVVFNVYHNEVELDIKCSCNLFEFRGILCRHICKVLIEKNVKEIPQRYILPRWRKDIKRRHTCVVNCYDNPQTSEENVRYNALCSHFSKAAEIGAISVERYNFLMKYVDEAIEKLMDNAHYYESHSNEDLHPIALEEVNEQCQSTSSSVKLRSPLKVRSKGRPPSKRKKSKVEEMIIRNKKKKAKSKENAQTQHDKQAEICTQESMIFEILI
ncbi:FHY3/FAR1 family protein [Dioscorea alata]|uniref:FHY3/FAR1 family protein n=1 Tax=Dioscorea alata TaxID=55571 RepID=A0ACB7WP93_DIOAL|nr:FHY3/FAR1 family protein [Dioscorea alata]